MTTLRHQLLDGQGNPVAGKTATVAPYRAQDVHPGEYHKTPVVSAVSDNSGWLTWTLPAPAGPEYPATYVVTGIETNQVLIAVPSGVSTVLVAAVRTGVLAGPVHDTTTDLVTELELVRRLSQLPVPMPPLNVWNGGQVAGNSSFLDWTHDNPDGGYLLHLHTGPNSDSGSLLALGVGDGGPSTTNGLLVSVKAAASAGAAGIGIVNQPGSAAYGLHAIQDSTVAPLFFLEQTADGAAPVLDLVANGNPTTGQMLQRWQSGAAGGTVGAVRADTGDLDWERNIRTADRIGGGQRSYVGVESDKTRGEDSRDHSQLYKESLDFYRWSGTPGLWWSARIDAEGQSLRLRAGDPTDTVGSPAALNTLIEVKSDGIGFFGHAPAAQPARPTDLAGVIAALAGLGITA
jgi:hypothetical protein